MARHYGQHGFVRFIEGGASVGNRYHTGEWDDSRARADKVLVDVEVAGQLEAADEVDVSAVEREPLEPVVPPVGDDE